MNEFHDVSFPLGVAFGATAGPERRNEIVLTTSGHETRNARFAHSRRVYDAGTGVRSIEDLYDVLAFFEARRGSLHAFRFRDPLDMKSCRPTATPGPLDQAIGTGDGATTAFQLVKTYGDYSRPIGKPAVGTVLVAIDGVEQVADADFTVDHATGIVTFLPGSAPGEGAAVTAGFVFDVPVRFDTERIAASVTAFKAGQIPTIPLIEVRL